MPARFTNLRPAEAKPTDRLRALHTSLYAEGEASAFRDSIVDAGLPAGIALAAARIASPDFAARAEYAVHGDLNGPQPPSFPTSARFIALARLLARTKHEALAAEIGRGELSPDLVGHIEAIGWGSPGPTTLASDDLLGLYLVPGAYADYRRLLGFLLKLARIRIELGPKVSPAVEEEAQIQSAARSSGNAGISDNQGAPPGRTAVNSGSVTLVPAASPVPPPPTDNRQGLGRLLLPSPFALRDDLHGPWSDNKPPLAWNRLMLGRILFPSEIAYRPSASAPGAGSRARGSATTGALAKSGLSPADIRRIESIAASGAAAAAGPTASKATAPDRAVTGKAAGKDQKNSS